MSRRRPCHLCGYKARYEFDGVRFCAWHILHFYIALHGEWHD